MKQTLGLIHSLKYATEMNATRYRPIVRYLLTQHEKARSWVGPHEIFIHLKEEQFVDDSYSFEHLTLDLQTLESWGTVTAIQDKESGFTIEEFRKRKYYYQLSELIQIVDAGVRLWDEEDESLIGSLEGSIFERIHKFIRDFVAINPAEYSTDIILERWDNVFETLKTLRERASRYIKHLNSKNTEEFLQTESFLKYKDVLVEYLRTYVQKMSVWEARIARQVALIDEDLVDAYIEQLVEHQSKRPRFDGMVFDRKKARRQYESKIMELKHFFCSVNGEESNVSLLFRETEKIILLVTRYARRLSEIQNRGQSRKEDYRKLAAWFIDLEETKQAHELSAAVFGVMNVRRLHTSKKATQTRDVELWGQKDNVVVTSFMNRRHRTGRKKQVVIDDFDREKAAKEILEEQKRNEEAIMALIKDNQIVLDELGTVEVFIRKTFLRWINRALPESDGERIGRTETGHKFRLVTKSEKEIQLISKDGTIEMPDYVFEFL